MNSLSGIKSRLMLTVLCELVTCRSLTQFRNDATSTFHEHTKSPINNCLAYLEKLRHSTTFQTQYESHDTGLPFFYNPPFSFSIAFGRRDVTPSFFLDMSIETVHNKRKEFHHQFAFSPFSILTHTSRSVQILWYWMTMFLVILISCLLFLVTPSFAIPPYSPELCGPLYTTPRWGDYGCDQKIKQCRIQFNIRMKWTGKGCRDPWGTFSILLGFKYMSANQMSCAGKPMGDGGCQCDQYW